MPQNDKSLPLDDEEDKKAWTTAYVGAFGILLFTGRYTTPALFDEVASDIADKVLTRLRSRGVL